MLKINKFGMLFYFLNVIRVITNFFISCYYKLFVMEYRCFIFIFFDLSKFYFVTFTLQTIVNNGIVF